MPAIEIRDLCYRYPSSNGAWVLQDVSLDVAPGEYVLLCGASGSGKSTLCRALNGLIPHFYEGEMRGSVRVGGLDTREHPVGALLSRVGMIFQNPTVQLFNRSVAAELAYGLESLGLPRDEILRRVRESAEHAGIAHLLDQSPHQLSGGEQQLVAIAAVLALHPQVIVLDEPYASLDPQHVRRVRAVLRRIGETKEPPAIVIAEHRLEQVAPDADRMLVMHEGRVVLDGAPGALLAQAREADLERYGLNLPPVARAARVLGWAEAPLTVDAWQSVVAQGADALPLHRLQAALSSDALCPSPAAAGSVGEPVLRAEGVTFAHRGAPPVLRGADLAVHAGESLALVGANGSGKTTLVKHFNGLYRPRSGQVWVHGRDTRRTRVSRLARQVGMVFQNANDQFFRFTVRDEIEVGARALQAYDAGWLDELVALLDLAHLLDRSPYRLSEGEKKRVAFCSALAARPEVLVLDEPTTGQDWGFRRALGGLLGELRDREKQLGRGQTVVLVTHDLEFAEGCAGRWALLDQGRVAASGRPVDLMADAALLRRAGLEATQAFRLRQALGLRAAGEAIPAAQAGDA